MPQLELVSWFFNFLLAWFFLFVVMTMVLSSSFPSTAYMSVAPSQKLKTFKKWLWT